MRDPAHLDVGLDLGQIDSAHVVHFDDFNVDLVADVDDIFHFIDVAEFQFGNMNESFLASDDVHEGAEIHQARDRAVVDGPNLCRGGEVLNHLDGCLGPFGIGTGDGDRAVVLDVDVRARGRLDLANDLTARPNDLANLIDRDLNGRNSRRVLRQLRPGFGNRLGHLVKDVIAADLGLFQGPPHDLACDPGYLAVHLKGRNPFTRAADLEIHIAEVVFVPEDVGQDAHFIAFLNQAHGDSGDGRRRWNAGVHHAQASAADRGHRTRTVALGNIGYDTYGVGEEVAVVILFWRNDALQCALGQFAMADFAPPRPHDPAGLADGPGREIVV